MHWIERVGDRWRRFVPATFVLLAIGLGVNGCGGSETDQPRGGSAGSKSSRLEPAVEEARRQLEDGRAEREQALKRAEVEAEAKAERAGREAKRSAEAAAEEVGGLAP